MKSTMYVKNNSSRQSSKTLGGLADFAHPQTAAVPSTSLPRSASDKPLGGLADFAQPQTAAGI